MSVLKKLGASVRATGDVVKNAKNNVQQKFQRKEQGDEEQQPFVDDVVYAPESASPSHSEPGSDDEGASGWSKFTSFTSKAATATKHAAQTTASGVASGVKGVAQRIKRQDTSEDGDEGGAGSSDAVTSPRPLPSSLSSVPSAGHGAGAGATGQGGVAEQPRMFGIPVECALAPGEHVPRLVSDTISDLLQRGAYREEGIFRLSASHNAQQLVKREYDLGTRVALDSFADPHLSACLLKLYLRELPEPLVPRTLLAELAALPPVADAKLRARRGHELLSTVAVPQRCTLHEVLAFARLVAQHATENLMPERNLSIIFVPALQLPSPALFELLLAEQDAFFAGSQLTLTARHFGAMPPPSSPPPPAPDSFDAADLFPEVAALLLEFSATDSSLPPPSSPPVPPPPTSPPAFPPSSPLPNARPLPPSGTASPPHGPPLSLSRPAPPVASDSLSPRAAASRGWRGGAAFSPPVLVSTPPSSSSTPSATASPNSSTSPLSSPGRSSISPATNSTTLPPTSSATLSPSSSRPIAPPRSSSYRGRMQLDSSAAQLLAQQLAEQERLEKGISRSTPGNSATATPSYAGPPSTTVSPISGQNSQRGTHSPQLSNSGSVGLPHQATRSQPLSPSLTIRETDRPDEPPPPSLPPPAPNTTAIDSIFSEDEWQDLIEELDTTL